MFKTLFIALISASALSAVHAETNLNGAGASFPAPVYQVWTYDYTKQNDDVKINNQSLGSGAGINQI